MPDHLTDAQQAAERRLSLCMELLWAEEGDADGPDLEEIPKEEWPDAPFCGCDTCIVREVLDAAWPHLRLYALEEESNTRPTDDIQWNAGSKHEGS